MWAFSLGTRATAPVRGFSPFFSYLRDQKRKMQFFLQCQGLKRNTQSAEMNIMKVHCLLLQENVGPYCRQTLSQLVKALLHTYAHKQTHTHTHINKMTATEDTSNLVGFIIKTRRNESQILWKSMFEEKCQNLGP